MKLTFPELEAVYNKWLAIFDPDLIKIVYAAVVAHHYKSNPIWLLVLGPVSGGKTTLLESLAKSQMIHSISTLTPAAVASGSDSSRSASFVFQANGKVAIIKEFNNIMAMHSEARNALFGMLREVYDGTLIRKTGRTEINWKGKISLIAGGTPQIESSRALEATLGERFITVKMKAATEKQIDDILLSSTKHTINKEAMENDLSKAAKCFLDENFPILATTLSSGIIKTIQQASKAIVKLRTGVLRDGQGAKEITSPIEIGELPARVNSQLELITLGLASLGHDDKDQARIILRLMRDGIPTIRLRTAAAIMANCQSHGEISDYVKVSQGTISRTIEELKFLGIIEQQGRDWIIADKILEEAVKSLILIKIVPPQVVIASTP